MGGEQADPFRGQWSSSWSSGVRTPGILKPLHCLPSHSWTGPNARSRMD